MCDCLEPEQRARLSLRWIRAGVTHVRALVREDLQTVLRRDPSIASLAEAALHPSLPAIWTYRIAHWCYRTRRRILARLLSNIARFLTGIEIHPGACIGRRFFVDHGSGVVIGETAVIGDDVTLYHGVTLGAVGWWRDNHRPAGARRHPHLGDRVVVGTQATLLGPLTVGDDAVIGAQALVLRDVTGGAQVLAPLAVHREPSSSTHQTHRESEREPEMSNDNQADSSRSVVVIGGGPGGSTAAALLAKEGVDVLLLERDRFPRYHIGESLAASCRVVMALSGALDKVEDFGFPIKRGALLQWGAEEDWTVDWQELFGAEASSWHVDRADFDDILLTNAAKQGAEVIQEATVKKVEFDGDRPVRIQWVRNSEPDRLLITDFEHLIDASGRAGILSAQYFRNRHPHEIFRNVAIWGYWNGGRTLPQTPPGGINVISSPDGWYWVIPLKDGRHSVGFVTHKDNFLKRKAEFADNEAMLQTLIAENDTVTQLLEGAEYYEPVRVEQDFSYVADHFCGPNYFLVGDAACFLDPLLSTGVHLSMYSAMLASGAILSTRAGEVTEGQGQAFYESLYRHAYARLLVLVSGVYEQYAGKANYFWLAQRMVPEQAGHERSNHAFVELTSGLTDLNDAGDQKGWKGAQGLEKEVELAKQRADEKTAASGRPGIAVFRLEPTDLYDEATGLHLVTSPRLGLRHTGEF